MVLNFGNIGTPERVISSFAFTDIASGTGVVIFYGASAKGVHFLTTSREVFSDEIDVPTVFDANSFVMIQDFDYDVTFNLPQTMKGKIIANIPIGLFRAAVKSNEQYVIVKVRHWDGSTETELGNEQTRSWFGKTATTGAQGIIFAVTIDVPRTKFKSGETLRITCELWSKSIETETLYGSLGQDPANRQAEDVATPITPTFGTGDITRMSFLVPFKLPI